MRNIIATYKYLFACIFAVGLLSFSALSAQAATIAILSPQTFTITVGQTLTVTVSVDAQDSANYAETIALQYPSALLTVSSFTYADTWMPVTAPSFDSGDATTGILKKTAVYPGGFSGVKQFATVTFVSKKAGSGTIAVGNASMASEAAGQTGIATASATFMVNAPFVSSGTSVAIREKAALAVRAGEIASEQEQLTQASSEMGPAPALVISAGVIENARFDVFTGTLVVVLIIIFLLLPTRYTEIREWRPKMKRQDQDAAGV